MSLMGDWSSIESCFVREVRGASGGGVGAGVSMGFAVVGGGVIFEAAVLLA